MKFLENVYCSIKCTYAEFSDWHDPFAFFITFCSRCGMEWDTAYRATDDPILAFLPPGAQEPPNNISLD